ncbi:hypothetical protein L0P88_18715 [Muricauda sp. SCSIO 64092]|nr:hypothetical protein [Muricauda sp. SCSIO 64092]UOY05959.1 hypothetical protein L0P88_18715 [Muricauda sp. SCSIO 64092]
MKCKKVSTTVFDPMNSTLKGSAFHRCEVRWRIGFFDLKTFLESFMLM